MNAAAHLHLHLMMKYLDTGSLAQEHQSRGGRSGRHWRLSSLLGSLSSFSAFPHTFTVHFILMHANRSTFAFGSRTKPELRHITPQGCWVIESEQTFPRTHANPHYMGGYGDLWEQRASRLQDTLCRLHLQTHIDSAADVLVRVCEILSSDLSLGDMIIRDLCEQRHRFKKRQRSITQSRHLPEAPDPYCWRGKHNCTSTPLMHVTTLY